jgi:tRNA pseudouridine38-40 synthase
MPSFKVTVAYDGTGLVGWQRQASGVSVQGLLEHALAELDGRHVPVAGAGRTDAGVHALGQVASFSLDRDIDAATLVRALNAHLPETVRALTAEYVGTAFHARFDASRKSYQYRIWCGEALNPFERFYVWHVPVRLDPDAMDTAARQLEGSHDFAAFQTAGSEPETTERTVFSSRVSGVDDPDARGRLILYDVTGDGFLRHMVRAVAGTLVEIGRGRYASEWMTAVLESRDRARAGQNAPAQGLFLMRVEY